MTKKFRKIVEGWGLGDYSAEFIYICGIIVSIFLTINISPYFVFLTLFFMFISMVGLIVFCERKVYWEEIKDAKRRKGK